MRRVLLAASLALPVLILLPSWGRYPFHPGSVYSDLLISHYPNALYIQRSLTENGVIPLWSPLILSGYPLAANPLAGLYYPPGWLALALPLPWGFNLAVALHLMWGGVGMYLLLRAEGLAERAALFGALLFEAMPKLYAHLGAGHLTLLYAVPWTPWLFLAEKSAAGAAGEAGKARWIAPGFVLGVIALADPRWAAYAGLAWLAYAVWHAPRAGWKGLAGLCARGAANLAAAGWTAAVLLLPLAEYTRLSTRAYMLPGENLIDSLPPAQWLGLVYPYLRGPAEWAMYPGGVALTLFALVVFYARLRRRAGFWVALIVVTLILALGRYFAPAAWLLELPGLSLLRVPPRALFLTGMAFAITAAWGLDVLLAALEGREEGITGVGRKKALFLFTLLAFAVLLGLAVVVLVDSPRARLQFGWGAVALMLGAGLIGAVARRKMTARWAAALFLGLALADLSAVNVVGLEYRTPCEAIDDPSGAAAYLALHGGEEPFRVYSPSYSIPQHIAAWYGLELADGVDPLILASYQGFMEAATGIEQVGYSVTLPPFADDPAVDHRGVIPDARRLGLLNVKYVAAEYEIVSEDLRLIAQKGQTRIYENLKALPRAWVQDPAVKLGQGIRSTPVVYRRPNRVTLEAGGPGLLVLAEVMYPGWSVRVDGQMGEIEAAGGLLRAVRLGPGRHVVEFAFAPLTVFVGAGLSGAAWLAALILGWLSRWGRGHASRAS